MVYDLPEGSALVISQAIAAVLVTAMVSSNGVVVSTDSKGGPLGTDQIEQVGQSAIAAAGPFAITMQFPGTTARVDYSFAKMVKALREVLPKDAEPARVAEAAKVFLAQAFAQYRGGILRIGDIVVIVAGLEGRKTPSVWTLRVNLSQAGMPPPMDFQHTTLTPGKPWPAGGGFANTDDLEKAWRTRAPHLVHDARAYSLEELRDISAWMIAIEAEKRDQAKLPVQQLWMTKKGIQRRNWSPSAQ